MISYHDILKKYWGYDSFRPLQEEIIKSIGEGKDTLGLMPTGGGKSLTFQVPTLAQEGLCLVITPLIALMKDQVQNLCKKGIKAAAIYSGMSKKEIGITLDNCIFGDFKFLYVSPERIATELFCKKIQHMPIRFITVDESHCISQWGYDFRPAYLLIADIRKILPTVPVLALTATATPDVVDDIQEKLHFKKKNVFSMSFERKNLAYVVRNTDDKEGALLTILTKVAGSAIVYVRSRRRTKEYAQLLNNNGISAAHYHAGLCNEEKDSVQQEWQNNKCRVIVATNAFGMGIDKPDVRVVIHMDLPDSIEAYFQEAGRAGRDGEKAFAIILYAKADKKSLLKRITDTYPDKKYIQQVYEDLNYFYQMAMGDGFGCRFEFNLSDFCKRFKYFPTQADSALKLLTQAQYIEYTDIQESNSMLLFLINRNELYRLQDRGKKMEQMVQFILRSYTGLFTDYTYIDERSIAHQCGLTSEEVYMLLKTLHQQNIIQYIPRKRTPYIIYTSSRIETADISLTPAVYENRKKRYTDRVHAILAYVTDQSNCRSRMLLRYFGEKNEHNCLQCDCCLSHHQSGLRKGEFEEIKEAIYLQLSKQENYRPIDLLKLLQQKEEKIEHVLHHLLQEEELELNNGYISRVK